MSLEDLVRRDGFGGAHSELGFRFLGFFLFSSQNFCFILSNSVNLCELIGVAIIS